MLRKAAKQKKSKILIGWNRGLGDIALGLYAIVYRIRQFLPDAEITFLARSNLSDGFSMLEGIRFIPAVDWKRGGTYSVQKTLAKMGMDSKDFDCVIERPSPTDWVRWQRGKLIPKLKWDSFHEELWKAFDLPDGFFYIAVQVTTETDYGLWRNWPLSRWRELFERLEKIPNVKVLLFGFGSEPSFKNQNIVDLRGKTNLFQLLSILKNRVRAAIFPDSGILSMVYYLDAQFPIHIVSLWADPNHGILKQGVFSPNTKLKHTPLIGKLRNLSSISAQEVINLIFPLKPLKTCTNSSEIQPIPFEKTGVILLAGGQGSRLGYKGPKGMFPIANKSLFQWICEKIPPDTPTAVMTSPFNHAETVSFFTRMRFFGRDVHFFQQEASPARDEKKRPLALLAPTGNGSMYSSFMQSSLPLVFEKRGIEFVSIVPIENILANPADPVLLTFLRQSGAEIAVQCIEKKEAKTPMGSLVIREGRLEIIEYMEWDVSLESLWVYTGATAMTLEFIKKMARTELPLHWVRKKEGNRFVWKGERFIFDALAFAEKSAALCYPRDQVYAPLKSHENLNEVFQLIRNKVNV